MRPPKSTRGPNEEKFWSTGIKLTLPSGLDARGFGNPAHPNVWAVHGWGSRSSHLRNIIESLLVQNYFVIAWDGPGHGKNRQKQTHLVSFAQLLNDDIESYTTGKAILIGHSFGGAACGLVASKNPRISHLITIAAPPDIREVFYSFWRRVRLSKKAQKLFIAEVKKMVNTTPLELSMVHYFPLVQAKWLVIHDKEDKDVKFLNVEKFRSMGPEIHFLFSENLGHHRILKNTWVITKIVQFLKSGTVS